MLGSLGKSWVGGVVAAALIIVGGLLLWRHLSGSTPQLGTTGDVLLVCPKDGERLVGPAPKPGVPPPACPKCGGEMVVARVFECHKGHIFVGYLEKPPDPASAQTDDVYKKHMPRLLRPGKDKAFVAGGAGSPVCPVCGVGMKRPVMSFEGVKLEDVKMGALPAAGGGS